MRNTFWNKRIPTLLGILLLVIGVAATSELTKNGVIFVSQASPAHTPENVRITNITDSSFAVSYTTAKAVPGFISFGKDQNPTTTATDDRSPSIDSGAAFSMHHITVKNVSPGTKYFFNITSGPDTFLNNEVLFEVSTAPTTESSSSNLSPINGKVITTGGQPPKEALVYVTTDNAQTLSTITKSDGSYTLSINALRNKNLNAFLELSATSVLKVLIVGDGAVSNISVLQKTTNPIPVTTLSQDYDFTTSTTRVASSSGQLGFPSFTVSNKNGVEPDIVTPKENQSFTDTRPTFRGTAQPNSNVTITIHSDENIEEKITSDSRGNWSFRPAAPLSPGEHTITITTSDQFGILKTISQTFTVHASGTTVTQSATPSATPTIVTATPAPTFTPTPTTTAVIPTAVVTQPPASKGGVVLEPGTPSIVLGIGAVVSTISGIVLFFLSGPSSL